MSARDTAKLTKRILFAYALPAFVVALPTIPIYINLPSYYGIELGLGLAATGLILLLARIFDTVTDPLIGVLSDRLNFKGARRKPWIAAGAVVAGVGLYKMLNPPADVDASYLLGWCILLYGGWTMVAVPYFAWGAELSDDYDERTRITSWREAAGLLGILGAGAVSAVAVNLGLGDGNPVASIAWLAIALGIVAFPILLRTVPDTMPAKHAPAPVSFSKFKSEVRSLAANAPFVRLLGAWFINGLANCIPSALFLIYLQYALGAGEADQPLFILVYFLSGVLAIPLWLKVSQRYGKHRTWCVSMMFAVFAFAMVPFIPTGELLMFGIVCVITGMALGADLSLPPAIQADVLDYDRWKHKRVRAGVQFAMWGMATKLALAVSVGIALPSLEGLGFTPEAPTPDGIWALIFLYGVVPIGIKVLAIAMVWNFPITAAKHAIIRKRLQQRDATTDLQSDEVSKPL